MTISEYIKQEGVANPEIEKCQLCIDVTQYLENDDEGWLRLTEEGIWNGYRQTDQMVKFIYLDDEDNIMLLGMDDDSFDESYDIDDEIYSFWNEPVSYKSFITVEDDIDNADDLDIEIDNSQVDIATIGEYPLTYTVTDSAGNVATKTVIMHILEPDTDEYYLMKANEICDMITMYLLKKEWALWW